MSISPRVTILITEHPPDGDEFPVDTKPIRIVGTRAIILLGVTLGAGAVVRRGPP